MASVIAVRNGQKLLDVASTDLGDGTAKLQVDVDMATEGIATEATLSAINGKMTAGVTANTATVAAVSNTLPMARYNASPTARTEGQFGDLQADASGSLRQTMATLLAGEDLTSNVIAVVQQPLATNAHAATIVTGISVTSVVGKASAGTLYQVYGYNGNAATRYIHIFNATSLPANGTAPTLAPFAVLAGQWFSLDLTPFGAYFATGIVVANSTTLATLTVGSADMSATVQVA